MEGRGSGLKPLLQKIIDPASTWQPRPLLHQVEAPYSRAFQFFESWVLLG
jgi:hypothetical protein